MQSSSATCVHTTENGKMLESRLLQSNLLHSDIQLPLSFCLTIDPPENLLTIHSVSTGCTTVREKKKKKALATGFVRCNLKSADEELPTKPAPKVLLGVFGDRGTGKKLIQIQRLAVARVQQSIASQLILDSGAICSVLSQLDCFSILHINGPIINHAI